MNEFDIIQLAIHASLKHGSHNQKLHGRRGGSSAGWASETDVYSGSPYPRPDLQERFMKNRLAFSKRIVDQFFVPFGSEGSFYEHVKDNLVSLGRDLSVHRKRKSEARYLIRTLYDNARRIKDPDLRRMAEESIAYRERKLNRTERGWEDNINKAVSAFEKSRELVKEWFNDKELAKEYTQADALFHFVRATTEVYEEIINDFNVMNYRIRNGTWEDDRG